MDLKSKIRDVPDFPKKGIIFKDITALLKDGEALRYAVKKMEMPFLKKKIGVVAGIESRGFILGAIIARDLGVGFVPIRKKGKLPSKTVSAEYALEYGTDSIEIHADAVSRGQRVLIVDDLIATGGTAGAAAQLIEKLGGEVAGFSFLVELSFLKGREKLKGYYMHSVVAY
ncbi:MAG TPA: adenine phosphoribosyltransferase [archaeon]|nr:adenine phosphoribosyltransferase [archaeon]